MQKATIEAKLRFPTEVWLAEVELNTYVRETAIYGLDPLLRACLRGLRFLLDGNKGAENQSEVFRVEPARVLQVFTSTELVVLIYLFMTFACVLVDDDAMPHHAPHSIRKMCTARTSAASTANIMPRNANTRVFLPFVSAVENVQPAR